MRGYTERVGRTALQQNLEWKIYTSFDAEVGIGAGHRFMGYFSPVDHHFHSVGGLGRIDAPFPLCREAGKDR